MAEPLPGRPNKPVLAGAAMAGAILVAVPLLIMATGRSGGGEEKTTNTGSGTVLEEDDGIAGQFVAESPSPSPSPSKKDEDEKEKEKPVPPPVAPPVAVESPSPSATPEKEAEEKNTVKKKKKKPSDLPPVLTRVLIKNNTNGTCVDIPGRGSGKMGGPIQHAGCDGSDEDNQLWNLEKMFDDKGPGGTPLFQIRNVIDSLCFDLPGNGGVDPATKVVQYKCWGANLNDNQLWWLDKRAEGRYWIRNLASNNMCLDSYEPGDPNKNLIIWHCTQESQNNHEWIITRG
ncbi:ricin-type beta-trefoil lectin domain protein [Streptomyces sp. PLAI1-29]|uniref:Ricin-type beta-trefoil lectin domain protein n=1 Tax=Streptomyces zingiberis TaxID=2053010 RepID=A0ABX1C8B4_9ACTN|nr:ricin-type beta-trefoil lectin domain protein [Streptomyces zingiberis]